MMKSSLPVRPVIMIVSHMSTAMQIPGSHGAWKRLGMLCLECQAKRFHMSAEKYSNKYLTFMPNTFMKNASRVMSSSSDQSADDSSEGKSDKSKMSKLKDVIDTIVKVQPTLKMRHKIDISQSYYDNIYVTPLRAMKEYLLESSDLYDLPRIRRRSPYPERGAITVYLQKDVERIALNKWGSLEKLMAEKKRRELIDKSRNRYLFIEKKAKREYRETHYGQQEEQAYYFNPAGSSLDKQSIFKLGSGKVVLYAVVVCGHGCVQDHIIILAIGIHQSLKEPDMEHPYGWMTFRNVSSLISGVGIFFLGTGLSVYHGLQGLLHPEQMESLFWAMAILMGSFFSEGATLLIAFNQVRQRSKAQNMGLIEYILRGQDPSTNVVLLEDLAAVMGVTIALSCMGITHFTGSPVPDAIGSLLIGSLLGGVASFIIYTNSIALVGRSIPMDKKQELMRELESDRMIRTLHDVKATDMGGSYVRFKAEVDFDGRELTRYYLESHDLEAILKEVKEFTTVEEMEAFMLYHGENIVDTLGIHVDRIEKNLKKKHPEVRHVDLEQL
ncbi:hypothetical protein LSH36_84g00079 [Paralvinella palmiformis]|uniref:Cation efflux protein transmembrane domain-containing protein n=1 Tax=Paralvinella palmiformis TaxID=53620 RepID=A0AAD9K323_9ANNE|nr:hypothetical protein LSH36_84g00079 [Paralvinella palmiformis]